MRKYYLNENFFKKIDTEGKAYYLGFMMADGYVRIQKTPKNVAYRCKIAIQKRDIEILENFIRQLNSNYPITENKSGYIEINIGSKMLVNDLISLGCVNKKSLILEFPKKLPKKYYNHFIRGYFDGDGCIAIVKNRGADRKAFSLLGTRNFLTKVQEVFNTELSVNRNISVRKIRNIYCLVYSSKKDIFTIGEFLYKNSSLFLKRKKEKFDVLLTKT